MLLTLKQARESKGLTPEELATKAGLALSQIHRLENGSCLPLYDTIVALEQALGVKRGTLTFRRTQKIAV